MKTFASVVTVFGEILLEEFLVEDDRKFEGSCILLPGVLGELWAGDTSGGRGAGEVRAAPSVFV